MLTIFARSAPARSLQNFISPKMKHYQPTEQHNNYIQESSKEGLLDINFPHSAGLRLLYDI